MATIPIGTRVRVPEFFGKPGTAPKYDKEGTVVDGLEQLRKKYPSMTWVRVDGQVEPLPKGFEASMLQVIGG